MESIDDLYRSIRDAFGPAVASAVASAGHTVAGTAAVTSGYFRRFAGLIVDALQAKRLCNVRVTAAWLRFGGSRPNSFVILTVSSIDLGDHARNHVIM